MCTHVHTHLTHRHIHTHIHLHTYTHVCPPASTNHKENRQVKCHRKPPSPSTSKLHSAGIPSPAQPPTHSLKLHLPRAAAVSKSLLFVNTIKKPTAMHHHPRGKCLPALAQSTAIATNGNGSPMTESLRLVLKIDPLEFADGEKKDDLKCK